MYDALGNAVASFAIAPDNSLSAINRQPSSGPNTCYVSLDKTGRQLFNRFGKLPVTLTIELTRNGNLVRVAERDLTIRPQGPPTGTTGQVGSPLETIRLVWPVL